MLSNSRILDIEYNLASYITKWVLIVYMYICISIFFAFFFSVTSACLHILSLYFILKKRQPAQLMLLIRNTDFHVTREKLYIRTGRQTCCRRRYCQAHHQTWSGLGCPLKPGMCSVELGCALKGGKHFWGGAAWGCWWAAGGGGRGGRGSCPGCTSGALLSQGGFPHSWFPCGSGEF